MLYDLYKGIIEEIFSEKYAYFSKNLNLIYPAEIKNVLRNSGKIRILYHRKKKLELSDFQNYNESFDYLDISDSNFVPSSHILIHKNINFYLALYYQDEIEEERRKKYILNSFLNCDSISVKYALAEEFSFIQRSEFLDKNGDSQLCHLFDNSFRRSIADFDTMKFLKSFKCLVITFIDKDDAMIILMNLRLPSLYFRFIIENFELNKKDFSDQLRNGIVPMTIDNVYCPSRAVWFIKRLGIERKDIGHEHAIHIPVFTNLQILKNKLKILGTSNYDFKELLAEVENIAFLLRFNIET